MTMVLAHGNTDRFRNSPGFDGSLVRTERFAAVTGKFEPSGKFDPGHPHVFVILAQTSVYIAYFD